RALRRAASARHTAPPRRRRNAAEARRAPRPGAGHLAFGLSGVSLNLSKVTFAGLLDVVNTATPTRPSPANRYSTCLFPNTLRSGAHFLPSALRKQLTRPPRRSSRR